MMLPSLCGSRLFPANSAAVLAKGGEGVYNGKRTLIIVPPTNEKLVGIGILQQKNKPHKGSGSCTFENQR